MSDEKETVTLQIPESFTFGNFEAEDFDRVLSFFDWSLKDKNVEVELGKSNTKDATAIMLFFLFFEFVINNECNVKVDKEIWNGFYLKSANRQNMISKINSKILDLPHEQGITIILQNYDDRQFALGIFEQIGEALKIDSKYIKTVRYVVNELLYNTLEHGRNGKKPSSIIQLFWNEITKELSFLVADIGIGIRKHLRQTYPNLVTDSEAILYSIKPQISGTFGRPNTGYETKNNAGVGLFFSSNIAQRLNADMFIVSGNGFVHISPTEIISQELNHQWKGTFVYVKIKLGLIEDLNLQKMLSEITKSIPKDTKPSENNSLYISVRNYFGRYAEDKDLAKKIRDEKLIPALAENKTLTLDFEEIVSAPHSLLNAMLATPIERLGLAAYKKIKIINAAPEIRETLDFIFDDNTSNA